MNLSPNLFIFDYTVLAVFGYLYLQISLSLWADRTSLLCLVRIALSISFFPIRPSHSLLLSFLIKFQSRSTEQPFLHRSISLALSKPNSRPKINILPVNIVASWVRFALLAGPSHRPLLPLSFPLLLPPHSPIAYPLFILPWALIHQFAFQIPLTSPLPIFSQSFAKFAHTLEHTSHLKITS